MLDIPPAKIVEATKESSATMVGLSGFLTQAYHPKKEIVATFEAEGLTNVKIMIDWGKSMVKSASTPVRSFMARM